MPLTIQTSADMLPEQPMAARATLHRHAVLLLPSQDMLLGVRLQEATTKLLRASAAQDLMTMIYSCPNLKSPPWQTDPRAPLDIMTAAVSASLHCHEAACRPRCDYVHIAPDPDVCPHWGTHSMTASKNTGCAGL